MGPYRPSLWVGFVVTCTKDECSSLDRLKRVRAFNVGTKRGGIFVVETTRWVLINTIGVGWGAQPTCPFAFFAIHIQEGSLRI